MLISCKCLNFVASSNTSDNTSRSLSSGNIAQFDKNSQLDVNRRRASGVAGITAVSTDSNPATTGDENRCNDALVAELVSAFVQTYSRNCVFYCQCMELLKQAIGPVVELSVTIQQRDLICVLPCNSWVLSICINCNTALCAKHTSDAIYLINSNLLTNNEELTHRKSEKSFSETFCLLIMDHQLPKVEDDAFHSRSNKLNNRLRSLTQNLQTRLQKEIADTDERIHRYTEQQFALLKSFREKSEQEYQILVSLVNQVPEQMIDAIGAVNSAPTTPTTLTKIVIGGMGATSNSSASATDTNTQPSVQSAYLFNNKKAPSFDTPPATPESTPMSIGNSPTFNRQQQQTSISLFGMTGGHRSSIGNGMFYVNPSPYSNIGRGDGMDGDVDCLFELEGVESYSMAPRASLPLNMSDVEESAEDAEDALAELEAAIPIPGSQVHKQNANNFAKSLPIAIANSVNESAIVADSDDDILDDNVDIAASIKALAKSVHGDAVFGDLPRPRLRTQI